MYILWIFYRYLRYARGDFFKFTWSWCQLIIASDLLRISQTSRGPGESTLHPNKTAFLDLEVGAEGNAGFRSLLTLLELVETIMTFLVIVSYEIIWVFYIQ